jgi:hypothetical protein
MVFGRRFTPHKLRDFELKDVEARALADGVAVPAYNVREELTVDGNYVSLNGQQAEEHPVKAQVDDGYRRQKQSGQPQRTKIKPPHGPSFHALPNCKMDSF